MSRNQKWSPEEDGIVEEEMLPPNDLALASMDRPRIGWKVIVSGVVLLIFLACALLIDFTIRRENERIENEYNQWYETTRQLRIEKEELEDQLKVINNELNCKNAALGTIGVLYTCSDATFDDGFYTLINNYGYKGMIAISESSFPGEKGAITLDRMHTLLDQGWEYCLLFDRSTDIQMLYQKAINAGLPQTEIAYAYATYDSSQETVLEELGFHYLIRYNRTETVKVGSTLEVITAYGSYASGFKSTYNSTIENSSALVITVGNTFDYEMYYESNLKTVLEYIEQDTRNLKVSYGSVKLALERREQFNDLKAEKEEHYKEEKQTIENRLNEIELLLMAQPYEK